MKRKFEQTKENLFDIVSFIPKEISNLIFGFIRRKSKIKTWRFVCKSWNEKVEFWIKENLSIIISNCDSNRIGFNLYNRLLSKAIIIDLKETGLIELDLKNIENVRSVSFKSDRGFTKQVSECVQRLKHVSSLNLTKIKNYDEDKPFDELKVFTKLQDLKMIVDQPVIDFEMNQVTHLELRSKSDFQEQLLSYFPKLKSLRLADIEEDFFFNNSKTLNRIESLTIRRINIFELFCDGQLKFDKLRFACIKKCDSIWFLNQFFLNTNVEHLILNECQIHESRFFALSMSNLKTIELDTISLTMFDVDALVDSIILVSKNLIRIRIRESKEIDYKRIDAYNWDKLHRLPNLKHTRWTNNLLEFVFKPLL